MYSTFAVPHRMSYHAPPAPVAASRRLASLAIPTNQGLQVECWRKAV